MKRGSNTDDDRLRNRGAIVNKKDTEVTEETEITKGTRA
jgi:hypothetical protein